MTAHPPGCGHGKTWNEPCIECSLHWYREGLAAAERRVAEYKARIAEDLIRLVGGTVRIDPPPPPEIKF